MNLECIYSLFHIFHGCLVSSTLSSFLSLSYSPFISLVLFFISISQSVIEAGEISDWLVVGIIIDVS